MFSSFFFPGKPELIIFIFYEQGKDFIEILNPGLKDPLVNCKTAGSNGIQKVKLKVLRFLCNFKIKVILKGLR